VEVHGPIDLTGVLDRLPAGVREGDQGRNVVSELLGVISRHELVVPGQPFGVTVSAGVLTQLLQSIVDSSLKPEDIIRVCLELRDKHIADLVRLTKPGGALVLVSDVVSSTTAPGLLEVTEDDLEEKMAELIAKKNFFTGTNPYRIVALLEDNTLFQSLVTNVRLLRPWLWAVTADRLHLTYAIDATRSATESENA
jgi:hypothetical protein